MFARAVVSRHWSLVRPADWPWRHFTPRELASRGDGSVRTVIAAGDALDALRAELGRPLVVTSGYRDPIHNARVGGAPRSRHRSGEAFDLAVDRQADPVFARALLDAALGLGFRGIGAYAGWLHVDLRPFDARWCSPLGRAIWGDPPWNS